MDTQIDKYKIKNNGLFNGQVFNLIYVDDYIMTDFYTRENIIQNSNGRMVCLCKNKFNFRTCIIKRVNKLRLNDVEFLRIQREIYLLSILNHPYIMKINEVIESKYDIYMIFDYYRNGDLHNLIIQNNKLNPILADRYMSQLLQVCLYLQKLGITHRDIKCENILLSDDMEHIILADFGFASSIKTSNVSPIGTKGYAPPEVIANLKYKGDKLDVFSCGVTYYVMLVGELPFGHDMLNFIERCNKGLHNFHKLDSLHIEILEGMLYHNENKRFTISECLDYDVFKPYIIHENLYYQHNICKNIDEINNGIYLNNTSNHTSNNTSNHNSNDENSSSIGNISLSNDDDVSYKNSSSNSSNVSDVSDVSKSNGTLVVKHSGRIPSSETRKKSNEMLIFKLPRMFKKRISPRKKKQ